MSEGLILVKAAGEKTLVAFLQDGRLMEYHQQDDSGESLVGALFLGRVERVLPAVKAAFVKLGLKQNGFLPLREQDGFHQHMGDIPLLTGNDVLVQVKKDPKNEKGAFLTRDVALPGQYVLFMPNNRHIGISKRIEDETQRSAARSLGIKLADGRFGLIVRHAALFARESDIREETEALYEEWKTLSESAPFRRAPEMLKAPDSALEALIRDYSARFQLELVSDADIAGAKQVSEEELSLLWRQNRVDEQLKNALVRKVELSGGGNLMIDQREALHTIDINSGSNVEAEAGRSLPLAQNLAAVSEIARQIRLRNLSGIVLIDFIDMDTEAERQMVLTAMEDAVREDRVKTVIHGFTHLGILEMTRKRTSDTLLESMTVSCKKCGGSGCVFPE